MFQHLIELCSEVQTDHPNLVWLITRLADFLIYDFRFIIHIELCSALWNYVRNALRIMFSKWTETSREETYRQSREEQISRPLCNIIFD